MKAQVLLNASAHEYFFAEGCYISEWSNSPDDAEASIARARVLPGVTTRWHSLTAITERYVILQGDGEAEVGGLPPMHVTTGDVVVIPAVKLPASATAVRQTSYSLRCAHRVLWSRPMLISKPCGMSD